MFPPRVLAYSAVFGAAAMLLPVLFHAVHLGSLFMPMYLPLMLLAFFVAPVPAAITAAVVPLLSGMLTGMPPFYPPIAVIMSVELAVMAGLTSLLRTRFPQTQPLLLLAPVLLLGRVLGVVLIYGMARIMELPAGFVAGASFLSGWPGIILMLVVIPAVLTLSRKSGLRQPDTQENV